VKSSSRQFQAVLVALCLTGMPARVLHAATVLQIQGANTALTAAPSSIGGRVVADKEGFSYQWPGVYVESAFEGSSFYFKVGPGDVHLHVRIDGALVSTLTKPTPGLYRVAGLATGPHQVRIEVASEHQANVNHFGGVWLAADAKPLPVIKRQRQIEFIGDSHTVGYGNTSPSRQCTPEQIWATTDNTVAFGPVIARRYQADYRINAISGRGIVRNYNGGPGDTLPEAYPYSLLNRVAGDTGTDWQPQIVVIALGTNDFSTPLNAAEKWTRRVALYRDFEKSYVAFVLSLRARYPRANFVLWATDLANGEILAEGEKVTAQLKQAGEARVAFVAIKGLTMAACDWHPSEADSQTIAQNLMREIDKQPLWSAAK
jgi:lysophospholipase L1-like esterase